MCDVADLFDPALFFVFADDVLDFCVERLDIGIVWVVSAESVAFVDFQLGFVGDVVAFEVRYASTRDGEFGGVCEGGAEGLFRFVWVGVPGEIVDFVFNSFCEFGPVSFLEVGVGRLFGCGGSGCSV